MNCAQCGGLVSDFEDELSGLVSAKCWNCGRDPRELPTRAKLNAMGIVQDVGLTRRKEMEGRRGRGTEYVPAGAGSAKVRSFSGP